MASASTASSSKRDLRALAKLLRLAFSVTHGCSPATFNTHGGILFHPSSKDCHFGNPSSDRVWIIMKGELFQCPKGPKRGQDRSPETHRFPHVGSERLLSCFLGHFVVRPMLSLHHVSQSPRRKINTTPLMFGLCCFAC